MDNASLPTVVAAFSTVTAADPTRPLITFYDDATGERTELSGATLSNWVSKTANLLVDGCGLGPGDVAAVALPAHWQAAAILLGCWHAGLTVALTGAGPDAAEPTAVGFASADLLPRLRADEAYALSLAPLALPFRPGPPPGSLDYAIEVRGFGDHFSGPMIGTDTPALTSGEDHAALVAAARALAAPPQARLLIDGDAHPDPRFWLLAPLVAGSSIVLCRNLDPDAVATRLAAEHATAYPG